MSAVPPAAPERFTLRFVSISRRATAAVERAGGHVCWDRRRRVWLVTVPLGANWLPGIVVVRRGRPLPIDTEIEDVRTTVYWWSRARGLCVLWSDGLGNLRHWRDGLPARAPCPCEGEADDPGPHRPGCAYLDPAAGRAPF